MKIRWCALLLMLLFMSGCEEKALIDFTAQEGEYGLELVWEERVYLPFCVISKSMCGEQIGVVEGDRSEKICEWNGFPTEEWLICAPAYDGGAILYKEQSVTEIPEGVEAEYPQE